ncbi:hypothetical protein [Falsiruegeria mediterranea]|uniref:Uncharacterized protein n=1 Tax=Falsiruegeria mediterranea M17 TaxID=1200281 RepID=A0A2R8C9Q4_9RHOB|nr:hypothetical protein [Falsiruegeria mediterranea]SPJ29118.1 hypothetical protein TRM7615_02630 [Falsiruegeria mediterranea M17]
MTARPLHDDIDRAHFGSSVPYLRAYSCTKLNPAANSGLTSIKAPFIQSGKADDVAAAHVANDQMNAAQIRGFGFRRTIRYGALEATNLSGAIPRSTT